MGWWNRFKHSRPGGRTRWYDEVADSLLLGALPDAALARYLAKEERVTAVVNLVAEWEGPLSAYQELGIEQLWLPIVDFTSPSAQDLERAVLWIWERTRTGGRVYVHCEAGKGR